MAANPQYDKVHEKTVSGLRYGCHNKPRYRDPLMFRGGFEYIKGSNLALVKFVQVENFGSLECRYDMSLTDAKCAECKHRGSGEAYSKMVHERAANSSAEKIT